MLAIRARTISACSSAISSIRSAATRTHSAQHSQRHRTGRRSHLAMASASDKVGTWTPPQVQQSAGGSAPSSQGRLRPSGALPLRARRPCAKGLGSSRPSAVRIRSGSSNSCMGSGRAAWSSVTSGAHPSRQRARMAPSWPSGNRKRYSGSTAPTLTCCTPEAPWRLPGLMSNHVPEVRILVTYWRPAPAATMCR